MSGSLSTHRTVSGSIDATSRLARLGPHVDPATTDNIFYNAAKANGSRNLKQTVRELNETFEDYNKTLPFAPESSLRNADFSVETLVGIIHGTRYPHTKCAGCSRIYLRLAYYPYTTHESQETAVFCIEYRMRKPYGRDERASQSHLQLCQRSSGTASCSDLETLIDSINLGKRLEEFNNNLAVSVAAELWRQARATHQHTHRRDYKDFFTNVESEVERFLSFWEELKDDVCHHLFTEKNTYFDSRDIGLFI
ncbi:hypothetical protein FSPOR_5146 [Fusarium sporotrichioides]|uniref:Uncharacterized protein n=1 Tax=Fusarium sporotrichioides TaxID=5514 RepID=A0A395S8D3_FUSSP|nr:hypothetical protein FSPOR_5146 [Fusarium sporotrichioides]